MNIFSLLFFGVTLILEFFTLLIVGALFARNGCGSGAFAKFVANLFRNALFTLYFCELQAETGSHLTAHTTIQSSRTAETVVDRK
jgi:hypothetical protein